jgi:superfamily II DNA or RNA helicase
MSEELPKLVIRDNQFCQLITTDLTLFNSIRSLLSYKELGVEYTKAFQNGWNGFTYLMDKKGRFLSGLLPKVEEYLNDRKVEYLVEDRRAEVVPAIPIDLTTKLQTLNMVPRDYQTRIVDTAIQHEKGIVRACTGSGKTLCTALLAAHFNKPTIIYVIGLDLLQQFHDLFSSLFDEPIGYIGDGVCDIQRINIATVWTIGRALKLDKKSIFLEEEGEEKELDQQNEAKILEMLKATRLHIFDESHIASTDTIKSIHLAIDPERIYGFSGTPFRDDGTTLLINGILGEQIIDVSASELIERGFLAQPIIKFVAVPSRKFVDQPYQTVYKEYVVENQARNMLIVRHTKTLLDKHYTPLILFRQIKHGKILLEMLQETGVKCEMLYGDDSLERRIEVKEMLAKKEIDTILASTIFDIGVDIPFLNALILCGSGKSSIRCLQRIGRVIRAFPGKKIAAVIDLYDQSKFLKKQANIRCKIYSSEKGFKVIKCPEMK